LNADGVVEVIFTTFGYPSTTVDNQYLFILSNSGTLLPRAPTVADVNGDGNGGDSAAHL